LCLRKQFKRINLRGKKLNPHACETNAQQKGQIHKSKSSGNTIFELRSIFENKSLQNDTIKIPKT